MTDTSIIGALRAWLTNYGNLATGAPILIEFLGPKPTQYGIFPMPGERVVQYYLDYSSEREYPFAIQSTESTADDKTREANSNFYEGLADWFDTQTAAGTLPTLGAKQQAVAVQALSWGFFQEEGQSETGVYQILCKLVYEQQA